MDTQLTANSQASNSSEIDASALKDAEHGAIGQRTSDSTTSMDESLPLRARPGTSRNSAARARDVAHGPKRTPLERYGAPVCCTIVAVVALVGGLGFQEKTMPQPWNGIAQVAGWGYFASWSLSFYPQLISNWRSKSVVGFSFDFALLNVLGFACLSIYYTSFYLDSGVRKQYRRTHGGSDNSVRANDVLFALHALLLTSLTLAQVARYDGGTQRVSTTCQRVVAAAFVFIVVYSALLAAFPQHVAPLPFLYLLSYVKVGVTASKYIPQAVLNFRRKSTVGFNIGTVLLDLTGGTLSLFQLVLEASVLQNISLITGDPVKLFLAVLSLGYDALLMYQHYILYAVEPLKERQSGFQEFDAVSLLPESVGRERATRSSDD